MRKNLSIFTIIALVVLAAGCKKDQNGSGRDLSAGALAVLHIPTDAQGRIVPNAPGNVLNLTASDTWLLDSVTRIPDGYTLNIPAGTTIQTGTARTYTVVNPLDPSDIQTRAIAGVLVAERGGKLNANGTASSPVVFTSGGSTTPGSFGGIVILGKSTVNQTNPKIEGLPNAPGTGSNNYGGSIPADNSGSLTYVRIEYPGVPLFTNQEINGLTLGGVGSATTLSHIQVSYSADDAFEFFGGNVNADHLIANSSDDDDFDFDFGYTGAIQFAVGLKDPNTTHSTSSGSSDANGIESDNDASSSANTPTTRPVLSNFTLLGYDALDATPLDLRNGNRWRRNTSLVIRNSIIAGFPGGAAFDLVQTATGTPDFSYNVLHAFVSAYPAGPAPAYVSNISAAATVSNIGLGSNPFYTGLGTFYSVSELEPTAAPATSGANFTGLTGFTTTTYRGAVDPANNWLTAAWVNL